MVDIFGRLGHGQVGRDGAFGGEKVNELAGKVIRAEVDRLLRAEYVGKAICFDCLAGKIPAGSGPPFTRFEIRRAVREMTGSPESLQ
jgi:hypothetical protein